MALPQNRASVLAILSVLEPANIGKTLPRIYSPTDSLSTVVSIIPAGDDFPGQEKLWFLWTIELIDADGKKWNTGLSTVVETHFIEELFRSHFQNMHANEYPYTLPIRDRDRFLKGLPPAVRIRSNEQFICFSFDWGNEQHVPGILDIISVSNPSVFVDSNDYSLIVSTLLAVRPEVYVGGPEPELPFESTWHSDGYEELVLQAAQKAKSVTFTDFSYTLANGTKNYNSANVVFAL